MLSNAPFAGRDMTIARPDFRKPFFLVAALMAAAVVPVDLMATVYTIAVDGSVRQGSAPHYWSTCVGTGTMWFCQKPAWRTAAKIGVAEAGFKMVRGHGTLMGIDDSDHIGIFHWPDTTKPPTYTWTTLDSIYDFIIDTCNMAPLVELNFMPKDLQKTTNIGKPKSWNKWRDLVDSFVTHCEVAMGNRRLNRGFSKCGTSTITADSGPALQPITIHSIRMPLWEPWRPIPLSGSGDPWRTTTATCSPL